MLLVGLGLRALGHPPLDYDEGVHFAASALLFRGVQPYRDFVFAHPPGILYALGWAAAPEGDPVAWVSVARWGVTLIGTASLMLVGGLGTRLTGTPWGGVLAALLYALHPEVVRSHQMLRLEPFMTMLGLAGAILLFRAPLAAGALLGAAVGFKLTALITLAACLLVAERRAKVALGAALGLAATVAPLALPAPGEFFEQAVWFQLTRPSDGVSTWRLAGVFGYRHLAIALLALAGLWHAPRRREGRLVLAAYGLTMAALLSWPTHWPQYNAALAPWECLLAACALMRFPLRWRVAGAGIASLVCLSLLPAARLPRVQVRIPADASLFAVDPAQGLLAGRLPEWGDGLPVVVDSYATQLIDAGRHATVDEAFADPASLRRVGPRLEASRYVLVTPRRLRQVSAVLGREYRPVEGDLYERR